MARFVVGFGNRGFFPPKYMSKARKEIPEVLKKLGHETLVMEKKATRLGAVETRKEGDLFAEFLKKNEGKFDGIVWTHPNFGDEVGMKRALREAGRKVPILLHAYPDDMKRMGKDERRDSFCGIVSTMDVLYQMRVPFVKLKPHVVSPKSPRFAENIETFAKICKGEGENPYKPLAPEKCTSGENILDGMVILAIGARTTPFYTTRFNELDAEKNGITIETIDLSQVFDKMDALKKSDKRYEKRLKELSAYTNWAKAPKKSLKQQVKLSVVLDEYLEEYEPEAIAIRCWTEFEEIRKIAPCASLSYLNHKGVPSACEVDIGNAIAMAVLRRYSNDVVACQDWNNNWYEDDDKFMFMHCGPHPIEWLKPGHYVDTHGILDHAFGEGSGYGCIQGRFNPVDFTYASCASEDGKLKFYVGEGKVTGDPIPDDYFGSAGVGEIPALQDVMLHIGYQGFKHHFSMTKKHVADPMVDALKKHPGFEVADMRKFSK